MACTTKPLSPESRKPLHTQVVDLREERIALLEKNHKLKDKAAELTKQLQKAAEHVSELQGKVEAGDLALPVDREFEIYDVAEAVDYMKANRHFGKIVLNMA